MNLATAAVTQRTNVKAPFEFRLPKFAPRGARSASTRFGPDDKIVATQRDTSTTPAKETVWEVVAGPTKPVGDPASGGSVQPDATGYCKCKSIDAEVERAIKSIDGKPGGIEELNVDIWLSWTATCGKGRVGCLGTIAPLPARGFRILGGGFTQECHAACERSNTQSTGVFSMTSGNAKAADGGVVFRIRFTCEERRTEKLYKLVFRPRGLVDREKSDLNGNRLPDGKER
jgi:hypothetical protein